MGLGKYWYGASHGIVAGACPSETVTITAAHRGHCALVCTRQFGRH